MGVLAESPRQVDWTKLSRDHSAGPLHDWNHALLHPQARAGWDCFSLWHAYLRSGVSAYAAEYWSVDRNRHRRRSDYRHAFRGRIGVVQSRSEDRSRGDDRRDRRERRRKCVGVRKNTHEKACDWVYFVKELACGSAYGGRG